MQHRFTPTIFLLLGGLLVWMATFVFVYSFAAVACARGFADVKWIGLPIVTSVTLLASLLAGVATALIVRRGYRQRSFIGFVTFASGGIALVALVLLTMPAMVVSACPQP